VLLSVNPEDPRAEEMARVLRAHGASA
jgi:hypothetical protein